MTAAPPESPVRTRIPPAPARGIAAGAAAAPRCGRLGSSHGGPGTRQLSAERHVAAQVAAVVAELAALEVEQAPLAALSALLTACAATETRVALRVVSASAEAPAAAPAGPERLISVRAAAARLAVTPQWIYEHQGRLPFVRRVGARALRVSEAALERYLTTRTRL